MFGPAHRSERAWGEHERQIGGRASVMITAPRWQDPRGRRTAVNWRSGQTSCATVCSQVRSVNSVPASMAQAVRWRGPLKPWAARVTDRTPGASMCPRRLETSCGSWSQTHHPTGCRRSSSMTISAPRTPCAPAAKSSWSSTSRRPGSTTALSRRLGQLLCAGSASDTEGPHRPRSARRSYRVSPGVGLTPVEASWWDVLGL